ncbi:hypothetical protein SAMN05444161_8772 [Rhizobiales bacterium GAS191]|nr:hypothetical protein SAMN05444161_8772 [Rhizobiales bacterium GAS191]
MIALYKDFEKFDKQGVIPTTQVCQATLNETYLLNVTNP